jgi:hypothetical protein
VETWLKRGADQSEAAENDAKWGPPHPALGSPIVAQSYRRFQASAGGHARTEEDEAQSFRAPGSGSRGHDLVGYARPGVRAEHLDNHR